MNDIVIANGERDAPAVARHPTMCSVRTMIPIGLMSVLGAIIGVQLVVRFGITANTAVIGALLAMICGRLPMFGLARFRSVHNQNLAQSAISAATFGAGNSLIIPLGILYLFGRNDLIMPMFIGAFLAMLVDGYVLFKLFGSETFPATAAWPPGVAAAGVIQAGDEGGRKAVILGVGIGLGVVGAAVFSLPVALFGVAGIGNLWGLTAFGIGLLVRGYSSSLFSSLVPHGNIAAAYVPQGMMLGAGIVALVQVTVTLLRRPVGHQKNTRAARNKALSADDHSPIIPDSRQARRALGVGALGFCIVSAVIALTAGLYSEMSWSMLLMFIVYAAVCALVHELVVGLAAMHSGWFPALAVAVMTLLIGLFLGFPPVALALLAGFSTATGPAFADMGYDLKAGYIIRGHAADPAFELEGRRQQFYAAVFAFVIAGIVVLFTYKGYFARNEVPPPDQVYIATIKAGTSSRIAMDLLLWAIPGALLQLAGGSKRQLGVMFATGLLIPNALAGWTLGAGLVFRIVIMRAFGQNAKSDLETFSAGLIAGDTLTSFCMGVYRNFRVR